MTRYLCLVLAAAVSWGASAEAKDATANAVAELVRTLGYGGAIHNFKNYVMRGESKYGDNAKAQFSKAAQVLASLDEQNLNESEQKAVDSLKKVVAQYGEQLKVVKSLHSQDKSIEQIDETVAVDDAAAIRALAILRAGQTWSDLQELEFEMGYGGGIHHFKNYILRADEQYHTGALLGLSKVLRIVTRSATAEGLTEKKVAALDAIESVVIEYQQALPEVEKLIGEGKTAKEIDSVVKIDDGPALKALSVLRKR